MIRFFCVYIVCVWGASASAQICDDKYGAADALLEQAYSRYGTLYSGGHNYNSVGPTLEIYRLLSGLPDSGMATRRANDAPFVDPPALGYNVSAAGVGETLLRSLTRLHDPEFRRDLPEGSTDSEILLNRLTVLGPYAGWWLTPDAPQLTDIERVIAQYAFDDGLDWLLTVQAVSARPHQISWHLQRNRLPRNMFALLDHATQKYAETEDLTWMIAIEILREGYGLPDSVNSVREEIDARFDVLRSAITDCSATAAEYVAFSIVAFEKLRQNSQHRFDLDLAMQLPPVLRRIAAMQMAKMGMRVYHRPDNFPSPSELATLSPDPSFAPWHNVGRSYRAEDIDALIAIHQGTPLNSKTYRLLNLLSVENLLRFAASREDGTGERRDLITAAYLRLFALGRDVDAARLIGPLQLLWPDRADLMGNLWTSSAPRDVRLARVALALPEPRTLVVPPRFDWQNRDVIPEPAQWDNRLEYWRSARRSRDLPLAIRTGGFLSRDLGFWMQGQAAIRRAHRRGISNPDLMEGILDTIPQTGSLYYRDVGIAGWAAWDELAQLGPETGLANRIGRTLVTHARDSTEGIWNRIFADKDRLAAEMVLVIQQGRRMIHGDMNGQPLGKVAFELLHERLGRTDVAARTPYWFICQERCEP